MKKIIFTLIVLIQSSFLFSQYESVVFDFEMAYFNNGQPLPAEEMLIVSGDVQRDIQAIEFAIYKANSPRVLYKTLWQRQLQKQSESFRLPVNYRLQSNTNYDVQVSYFKELTAGQKQLLQSQILDQVRFYRQQQIRVRKGRLVLQKSPSKLYKDFNQILQESLSSYRPAQGQTEIAFSQMLEMYLKSLAKDSLSNNTKDLENILDQEVKRLLASEWWVTSIVREVKDYSTEKINGALALNVGYGGILLSGQADNFTYGSAPYVGLSIPLSNRAHATALLRNTSVSLGAFVQNLDGPNEETFTGPVFGRPYFAGLGYSVFRFIRLNAGVVALEEKGNGENPSFELSRIKLQPFVGLSAEIKFSVGLNR